MSAPNCGRSPDPWAGMGFTGEWRRYQHLALDAFDADVAARRRHTHVVAPPGSGKTLVGLEMARRLGRPALVLCPTSALVAQWLSQVALFGAPAPGAVPLRGLTYQALCRAGDPQGALSSAARHRLAAERAAALGGGATVEGVLTEFDRYEGAAARRLDRDIARVTASLKRELAREGHGRGAGLDLLAEPAARRLEELRAAGVGTVIVDECHHLLSLWGYLVRVVLDTLGDDVHLIGLTATSPAELTVGEEELYRGLLADVDFEIPTPAVVKDGFLAPYQELALFTTPLDSELAWLRERHARFEELLDHLHRPAPADAGFVAFPEWVASRIVRRDTEQGTALSFPSFARRHPDLARAGLRYIRHTGGQAPPDAPRGEGWSEAPDVSDWLVLLEDWALRALRPAAGEAAAGQWAELATGLADLGYLLTRRGVRGGRSDIDRVLVNSAAKPLLVCDAIAAEHQTRGVELRALVFCDSEFPPRQPEGSPLILAGGGRALLAALGGDVRTDLLSPVLLTGETLACLPADDGRLVKALEAEAAAEMAGTFAVVEAEDGLSEIVGGHPDWSSALAVRVVTRLFAGGTVQVLVATRALLGEGWDCPPVNVLVDATTVAASVSVRQLRGRSLRLDPAQPDKLASNWDVVCVAPELERGQADYQRFVRRHSHLYAPGEDGSIETGVSHVHPELSPFAPPDRERFTVLNAASLSRSGDLDSARQRWRLGEPYRGVDLPALLVRRRATADPGDRSAPGWESDGDGEAWAAQPDPAKRPPPSPRGLGWAALSCGAGAGVLAVVADPLAAVVVGLGAVAATAGGWWRAGARQRRCPVGLDLERVARAVLDTYVALGEITPASAASLRFTPRPGGFQRAVLPSGTPGENTRFESSLAEAVDAAANHRYLVSRRVAPALGPWRAFGRSLRSADDAGLEPRWHPVPTDLGRNKGRAETYLRFWRLWVSPDASLCFTQGDDHGRRLLLEAIASPGSFVVNRRHVWV
ncbi:MAG: DEAD/DEAH box helicase family protein [Actinomycetota bacterium]|jgi:superfamily II DNA or RNA helicase